MKATHFKNAVCALLAIGMLALSGCGRSGYICEGSEVLVSNSVTERDGVQPQDESASQAVQNENGSVIAVEYVESGGEDGRVNHWSIYREDDRYVFAYTEKRSQLSEVFEISEEEYNEIMSLNYEKAIAKYEATSHAVIYDDIYYSVRVVCANGEEISGEVDGGKLKKKFTHLYKKYIGDAEID